MTPDELASLETTDPEEYKRERQHEREKATAKDNLAAFTQKLLLWASIIVGGLVLLCVVGTACYLAVHKVSQETQDTLVVSVVTFVGGLTAGFQIGKKT